MNQFFYVKSTLCLLPNTTDRPASWPKDPSNPENNNNIEMMIAQNASSDRPVLLNVGGKRFEVSEPFF